MPISSVCIAPGLLHPKVMLMGPGTVAFVHLLVYWRILPIVAASLVITFLIRASVVIFHSCGPACVHSCGLFCFCSCGFVFYGGVVCVWLFHFILGGISFHSCVVGFHSCILRFGFVFCSWSCTLIIDLSTKPLAYSFILMVEGTCIRAGEYLSLLHRIEFFSSIFKFLAEFREKFKQL